MVTREEGGVWRKRPRTAATEPTEPAQRTAAGPPFSQSSTSHSPGTADPLHRRAAARPLSEVFKKYPTCSGEGRVASQRRRHRIARQNKRRCPDRQLSHNSSQDCAVDPKPGLPRVHALLMWGTSIGLRAVRIIDAVRSPVDERSDQSVVCSVPKAVRRRQRCRA